MTTTATGKADADKPMEESAERLARPLIKLAKACGVATFYIDQQGSYTEITDEALVGVLDALGMSADTQDNIAISYEKVQRKRSSELLPPTVVSFNGAKTCVPIHAGDAKKEQIHISLTLEDGTDYEGSLGDIQSEDNGDLFIELPDDLPMGYHTLHAKVINTNGETAQHADVTLIAAPARIPLPESVKQKHRWGFMTQMYSVRSKDSWGIGDYGDLRRLLKDAGEIGKADFMLINPIHACAPVTPLEPSPYLPESRRFLNVTYIRPQDIPEYAELSGEDLAKVEQLHESIAPQNNNPNPIDINAAWDAKLPALRIIFKQPRSTEREREFSEFKHRSGEDLDAFATWCVAFEVWGAPWGENLWFDTTGKGTPQIERLKREHADLFEFHRWPTMELKQISVFALKSLNLRSAFACSVKPQILAPRSTPNFKRNTPSCKSVKIFTRTMLKLTKLALAFGRTRLLENNTQRRKLGIPCSVDIYRIWIIVLRSNRLMQLLYFSKILSA